MSRTKAKIDSTDQRLLSLLRADARKPLVALAREIGLSRSATIARIKRMERDGVIAGYSVMLALPDEGQKRAWIVIRLTEGYRCRDVAPVLLEHVEVHTCHSLAGDWDVLLGVAVDSNERLAVLRDELAAIKGVANATTFPVLIDHLPA